MVEPTSESEQKVHKLFIFCLFVFCIVLNFDTNQRKFRSREVQMFPEWICYAEKYISCFETSIALYLSRAPALYIELARTVQRKLWREPLSCPRARSPDVTYWLVQRIPQAWIICCLQEWYFLVWTSLALILGCTLQCSISLTLIIIYKVTKPCISVFVFQTSSSGSISSPIHELVTDGYTLQVWEFGETKTMFPRLETITVNIFESLPADVVKILPDTIAELCLQKVTYGSYGTIRKYNSLCGILIEHFRQLVKLTFIDLRIGNTDAESMLASLRSHEHLKLVRCVYLDLLLFEYIWIHLSIHFLFINNHSGWYILQKPNLERCASIT